MSKEIQKVLSWMVIGIGLSSPFPGGSADSIGDEKPVSSDAATMDTVGEIETSSVLSEEEKKIIDLRFGSFLGGEGEYNDEELNKRVFCSYNAYTKADLGLFDMEGSSFSIQGILLGNFNIDNRVFVAIGVKDRNKERKIVISEWPVKERIKAYSNIEVREMIGGSSSASFESKKLGSVEEASLFLDSKIGDVLAFGFYNLGDRNAFINKYQGKVSEEKMNFFLDYVVPRGDINMNLASGVLIPSIKEVKMLPYQVDFIKSLKKKDLVGVSNYGETFKLINDNFESFPLLGNITYNKYLH